MKKLMISLAVLLVATGALAQSYKMGQIYQAEDTSPVLWVHNVGTEKVTFHNYSDSSSSNRVIVGSYTNSIDMSGAYTVADLATAMAGVSNSSGTKVLEVDLDSIVLGTESCDDEMLVGNNSVNPGDWGKAYTWDTSDTKHFRVYYPPANKGAPRKAGIAKSVAVDAGGTGSVTTKCWIDGAEKFSYVSVQGTKNISYYTNVVEAGVFDIPLDIVVGASEGLTVSADRATTGTIGGILLRIQE